MPWTTGTTPRRAGPYRPEPHATSITEPVPASRSSMISTMRESTSRARYFSVRSSFTAPPRYRSAEQLPEPVTGRAGRVLQMVVLVRPVRLGGAGEDVDRGVHRQHGRVEDEVV